MTKTRIRRKGEESIPSEEAEENIDDPIDEMMDEFEEEAIEPTTHKQPVKKAISDVTKTIDNDFSDILEGLNFGADEHKVVLMRQEPKYDVQGNKVDGYLTTYKHAVTVEEIKKAFGGGVFRLLVHGPRDGTGRGAGLKARKDITVAGQPKSPELDARKARLLEKKDSEDADRQQTFLANLIDKGEKRVEEARRESAALRREMQESQNTMFTAMAEMSRKEDPTAAMTPMMEMMREDSRRREETAREERARIETQRREDRAEQERRDAEASRQHDLAMVARGQELKIQMEQMRIQSEENRIRAEKEALNQQNQMQMMMKMMMSSGADKAESAQNMAQMQMQMFAQMQAVQSTASDNQSKILMAQLRDAKSGKDDFFSSIEKFQAVQSVFGGGGGDTSTLERVFDKLTDAAPLVMAGLGSVAAKAATTATVVAPLPINAPGTVAVVENIGVSPLLASSPQPPQPVQPPPQPIPQDAVIEQTPTSTEREMKEITINPLKAFPQKYPLAIQNMKVLQELVYRLDLAVKRDMNIDEMYANCIAPLPSVQTAFLKALDIEALVAFIEDKVPVEWPLRSLDGEAKLRAVHARLVAGK